MGEYEIHQLIENKKYKELSEYLERNPDTGLMLWLACKEVAEECLRKDGFNDLFLIDFVAEEIYKQTLKQIKSLDVKNCHPPHSSPEHSNQEIIKIQKF